MTKIPRNENRPAPRRTSASPWPILLAAASLGCAALRAPLTCPEKGGPPWTALTSRHFVMQTDTAPEAARATLTKVEEIYSSLASVMHQPASEPSSRIELVVFERSKDLSGGCPPPPARTPASPTPPGHGRLTYYRFGQGPDVVMIHGWPLHSATFRSTSPPSTNHEQRRWRSVLP
jgi:hypothetical protein